MPFFVTALHDVLVDVVSRLVFRPEIGAEQGNISNDRYILGRNKLLQAGRRPEGGIALGQVVVLLKLLGDHAEQRKLIAGG